MQLEDKIKRLEDYLCNKKCVLAFSAGSDSTLLAYILSRVSPDSLLVTINNNMMADEFIDYTKSQAKKFNMKHIVVDLDFLSDGTFQANGKDRCYECRKLMYSNIQSLDEFGQYDYFLEGTNITDLLEDRPGILVLDMFNMTSPLVECGITKEDVFDMIEYFGLEYSFDTTCLATRVKTNQSVDLDRLSMISEAERFVRSKVDQENVRVRFDNYNATISVDSPLDLLDSSLIVTIRDKLHELGFNKVLLDVTGYEKTSLEWSVDDDGSYYYQLPYDIDLVRTKECLDACSYLDGQLKLEDKLTFNDIVIYSDGKVSMPACDNFVYKFNQVLGCIKRSGI